MKVTDITSQYNKTSRFGQKDARTSMAGFLSNCQQPITLTPRIVVSLSMAIPGWKTLPCTDAEINVRVVSSQQKENRYVQFAAAHIISDDRGGWCMVAVVASVRATNHPYL